MQLDADIPLRGKPGGGLHPDESQGGKNGAAASGDRAGFELFDQAQELRQAQDLVQGTPDLRMDRIEAIRAAIADGSYQVAGRDVARKMLQALLLDPPC